MSTFDPDNEAIVSTRQLDQDYIIDSTALRKAFPDFATGSTNSDISVEVGRGYEYQKVSGLVDNSRNRRASYKESVDPIALRKNQNSHRRHQDPPALGTLNRRSSRFSPPKTRQRPSEPEITSSQQPTTTSMLLKTLNAARKSSSSKGAPATKPQAAAATATATFDPSIIIPEVTSISEIVTGTLHFNSRVDRVTSTPQVQNRLPLATVPVPSDQQAMFAALKLLHDKVAGLEEGQVQMRRTIEDLRSECTTLKQKLKKNSQVRPAAAEIDPDEEDVFDISMRRMSRQKSQDGKTSQVIPAPAQTKPIPIDEKTKVEVLRESVKENADENIIRREVTVPAQATSGPDQKSFGVEIKVNFQGLSLG